MKMVFPVVRISILDFNSRIEKAEMSDPKPIHLNLEVASNSKDMVWNNSLLKHLKLSSFLTTYCIINYDIGFQPRVPVLKYPFIELLLWWRSHNIDHIKELLHVPSLPKSNSNTMISY